MPTYPPDLAAALRSLQRQIDQINTARPGPMSWGPDDGHIRFYAADGRVLFQANSAGASVEHRGALTGLTPLLNGQQDTIEAHDGRMDTMQTDINTRATKTYVDGNITTVVGRLNGLDSLVATKAAVTYVDTKASWDAHNAVAGRVGSLEGQMPGKAAVSYVDAVSARTTTAQARADAAYSRAGTAISDAASAMSRANAAYNLASGGPSSNEVAALRQEVDTLKNRMARLEAIIDNA